MTDIAREIYLSEDRVRLLEDEKWAELSQFIDDGSHTPEQAIDEFLDWRKGFKTFGEFAVSDTAELDCGDGPELPPDDFCMTCGHHEASCKC
jgi:hypothetical protein